MTIQQLTTSKTQLNLALEASIRVGLAILLAVGCLLILYPFLPLLSWGIIIAVSAYPAFKKVRSLLGERERLAATLFSVVLLALLIGPMVLLAETVVHAAQNLAAHLQDGTLHIPPPSANVETWPVIGTPLRELWDLASRDLGAVLRSQASRIKSVVPGLFSASATVAFTVLQFALSIVVAGVLLANAQSAYELTYALCKRIFGEKGLDFQKLMGATIRSVTTGILGVALIQSLLAGFGFLIAGLPGAGLWALIFLVSAILQAGVLVLIPAVIYMFTISSATKASIFLIWCIVVALIDNVLKPLLLGRGVAVPIAVVFLGAIGGFITLGLVGLFVGAVVLSVGYELFRAWLGSNPAAET